MFDDEPRPKQRGTQYKVRLPDELHAWLKEMAEKLNEYYISFYDENCSNLNEDSRADKIIKHAYWLDILKGIQNINEEYIDYEFSSEKS